MNFALYKVPSASANTEKVLSLEPRLWLLLRTRHLGFVFLHLNVADIRVGEGDSFVEDLHVKLYPGCDRIPSVKTSSKT